MKAAAKKHRKIRKSDIVMYILNGISLIYFLVGFILPVYKYPASYIGADNLGELKKSALTICLFDLPNLFFTGQQIFFPLFFLVLDIYCFIKAKRLDESHKLPFPTAAVVSFLYAAFWFLVNVSNSSAAYTLLSTSHDDCNIFSKISTVVMIDKDMDKNELKTETFECFDVWENYETAAEFIDDFAYVENNYYYSYLECTGGKTDRSFHFPVSENDGNIIMREKDRYEKNKCRITVTYFRNSGIISEYKIEGLHKNPKNMTVEEVQKYYPKVEITADKKNVITAPKEIFSYGDIGWKVMKNGKLVESGAKDAFKEFSFMAHELNGDNKIDLTWTKYYGEDFYKDPGKYEITLMKIFRTQSESQNSKTYPRDYYVFPISNTITINIKDGLTAKDHPFTIKQNDEGKAVCTKSLNEYTNIYWISKTDGKLTNFEEITCENNDKPFRFITKEFGKFETYLGAKNEKGDIVRISNILTEERIDFEQIEFDKIKKLAYSDMYKLIDCLQNHDADGIKSILCPKIKEEYSNIDDDIDEAAKYLNEKVTDINIVPLGDRDKNANSFSKIYGITEAEITTEKNKKYKIKIYAHYNIADMPEYNGAFCISIDDITDGIVFGPYIGSNCDTDYTTLPTE